MILIRHLIITIVIIIVNPKPVSGFLMWVLGFRPQGMKKGRDFGLRAEDSALRVEGSGPGGRGRKRQGREVVSIPPNELEPNICQKNVLLDPFLLTCLFLP